MQAHRHWSRRGKRWISALVIACAIPAAGGLLTSANAAPGGNSPQAAAIAAARARPAADPAANSGGGNGLPPLPVNPEPNGIPIQDDGLVADPVTGSATKAKVSFAFPPVTIRAYTLECLEFTAANCKAEQQNHPVLTTVPWFDIAADTWVRSPTGSPLEFGQFPPVTIEALAFGALPVKATIQVSQLMKDGLVVPLNLQWSTTLQQVPVDQTVPGYGKPPNDNSQFWAAPNLGGKVLVKLGNVTVDGVPLNVGSACETTAAISLTAPAGFVSAGSTPAPGKPGAYNPLAVPSYLAGNLNVPAFTGCGSATENLSPLITSLVSSPINPVKLTQTVILTPWCQVEPKDCPTPTS